MDESWLEYLKAREVRVLRAPSASDMPDPPPPMSLGQVLEHLGQGRSIKEDQAQRVYLLPASGKSWPGVVIKVVRFEGWSGKFAAKTVSPLLKEFSRLLAAARLRLPTPRPYSVLVSRGGAVTYHYLLMECFDGMTTLESWLSREGTTLVHNRRARDSFARQLGSFMARIHRGTLYHDDLHLGNILVNDEAEAGDELDMRLIDIADASFVKRPGEELLVENLAQLTIGHLLRASRTDRMRFFRVYCRERDLSGRLAKRLMERVEDGARTTHFHLNTRRIAACMEQTRQIQVIARADWEIAMSLRAGAMKWHVLEATMARGGAHPRDALRRFIQDRVPADRLQIIEAPLERAAATSVHTRQMVLRSLWGGQIELYSIRVPTGEPLCCYVDAEELHIYLRHPGERKPFPVALAGATSRQRRLIFERLGRTMNQMFSYGNYFLTNDAATLFSRINVLLPYENPLPQPAITAVDHLLRAPPGNEALAASSLALWIAALGQRFPRADVGRFLRAYWRARRPGMSRTEMKRRTRSLLEQTQKQAAEKA